jgi:hypothetical protein
MRIKHKKIMSSPDGLYIVPTAKFLDQTNYNSSALALLYYLLRIYI